MWEEEYKNNRYYWGLEPNLSLQENIDKIPKGRALDLGAGEGRNSFFLAEQGFQVDAVDNNKEGLKKIEKIAKEKKLPIKTIFCNIQDLEIKEKYSLIISVSSVDFLKKEEIKKVFSKIKKSLLLNGFVFLSIFSNQDPLYELIKGKKIKELEENTFYLPKFKIYRHFFKKAEISQEFKNFDCVFLRHKKILDDTHDNPHYHNIIEFLGQKKKATK